MAAHVSGDFSPGFCITEPKGHVSGHFDYLPGCGKGFHECLFAATVIS